VMKSFPSTSQQVSANVDLNIDLENDLSKIKVQVPLLELAKLPSQREKFKKKLSESIRILHLSHLL